MTNVKQVIVMRNDLGMRKGKMIAQGAHASISFLTHKMRTALVQTEESWTTKFMVEELTEAEQSWIEGAFTKVCVRVDSEEDLVAVHEVALAAGLTSKLITDSGLTEFAGVPTKTCCAIGPDFVEAIDKVTGHLVLL